MRYLSIGTIEEIDRMTFWEYSLRMKAHALKTVDRQLEIHQQAWANREIQATRKKGKHGQKYVYRKMTDFFDYDALVAEITDGKQPESKASGMMSRAIEYERRKQDGKL